MFIIGPALGAHNITGRDPGTPIGKERRDESNWGEWLGTPRSPEGADPRLPRSPSGRVPQWVIDERSGAGPASMPWRAAPTYGRKKAKGRRPARGRRLGRIGSISALVLLVGYAALGSYAQGMITTPILNALHVGDPHPGRPTPGQESASKALGAPVVVTAHSSSYRFMNTADSGRQAVAYDPCRPIHYVTRTQGQPAGGHQALADAFARLSLATGLKFVDDGPTDETPSGQRHAYQPKRYGDRWAPVLIAWESPTENPDFSADVVGEAGSYAVGIEGSPTVYVSGQVRLDAPRLSTMLGDPKGSLMVRAIVEHELGHLVGLAHVTDHKQLMYPETELTQTDYGPGDLTGLALLGQGPCVPQL